MARHGLSSISASAAAGAAAAFLMLTASQLPLVAAKTDLAGCATSTVGASLLYYLPDTGEICDFLDCGGGRAPPKTTVPGCPAYVGTDTYQPSFLPKPTPSGDAGQSASGSAPASGASASATPAMTGSMSSAAAASGSASAAITGSAGSSSSASASASAASSGSGSSRSGSASAVATATANVAAVQRANEGAAHGVLGVAVVAAVAVLRAL